MIIHHHADVSPEVSNPNEQRNRIRKHVDVLAVGREADAVVQHHVLRADGVEAVEVDVGARALDAHDVLLAVFRPGFVGAGCLK